MGIRKFSLRLLESQPSEPSKGADLDQQIIDYLDNLNRLGGYSEWLRNAVRNQFIAEVAAITECEKDK